MGIIYKLTNGQYVSDGPFDDSLKVVERIECEIESIPLGDFGYRDHCLIVRRNGKLGMMFLFSQYPVSYYSSSNPFKYDKLKVYTGYCDDYAYVIAYNGEKCSLLKVTDGYRENITVLEEDCKCNSLWQIPIDHLVGPSFSRPKQHTPTQITKLRPDEIFVFGSNKEGNHAGGAAAVAANKFKAQWGVGVGRTGQSYAIPTMDGSLEIIAEYVEGFRCYAKCHPELTFYVTPIGCGIAGWKEKQISPLFHFAHEMANVILPKGW